MKRSKNALNIRTYLNRFPFSFLNSGYFSHSCQMEPKTSHYLRKDLTGLNAALGSNGSGLGKKYPSE